MSAPREAEAIPFSKIKRERVEWLVPDRVPLRAVTVLFGVMGQGKSMLACLIAAQLSRGELGAPGVTLMASAEDSTTATIKPRLEAAGADLDLVRTVTLRREGLDEGITIPDDMPELARLVEETGARLVVIDPLSAHLPVSIDSYKDQSVRRALAPLHRLADEHGVAVLAILHPNKGSNADPLFRIGGSGAFPAAARSVLLFARDPDEGEEEAGTRRILAHVKCNVGPQAPSLVYDMEPILIPAHGDEPEVDTARFRFVGESQHRGFDLLNPPDEDERPAIEEAADFLSEFLASGERPSKDVKRGAKADRIAPRTLARARKQCGVKIRAEGVPRTTFWSLPASCANPLGTTVVPTPLARLETPLEQAGLGAAGASVVPSTESGTTELDSFDSDPVQEELDYYRERVLVVGDEPKA